MPFVKRHRTYYKYGTEPNASIVGSFARIDEGTASGFSAGNYLTAGDAFNPSSNSWEIVFKITTSSDVTTYQHIYESNRGLGTGSLYSPIRLSIENSYLYANLSDSLSGETIGVVGKTSSTILIGNTSYYIKLMYDGAAYKLYLSTDGETYKEVGSLTSSKIVYQGLNFIIGRHVNNSYVRPFLGSVDLSQSYININGERWWSGDSYTKVGSWIENGVVSGFTAGNYLTTPETFNPQNNSWEMVYKFTTGDDVTTEGVITGEAVSVDYQNVLSLVDARILFRWSSSHSSYDYTIEGSSTILANTTYWVKLKFDGVSTYTIELSTNGVDFTVDGSRTVTGYTFNSYSWNIGRSGHSTTTYALPFTNGSIDLNQSYIKINNKDWWHGTKAVESDENNYDYYIDNNKLYQLAAVKRSYWKYDYRDWTQPVLTSATSSEKVIITSTSDYDSGYANWRVLDGSSTPWLSGNGTGQGSVRMEFPRPLKISSISVTGWSNPNGGTANVTIYKDLDNTEVVGTTQYFGGSIEKTWVFDAPVITDKLSFHITGTTAWGCASEIKIIAQEQIAVEVNLNGEDIYEDWEQPVLTGNGIMGGDKFAVNSIATNSNYPAYKSFDGDRSGWGAIFYKTSGYLEFYNPNPLKVSSLNILNFAGDAYGVRSIKKGYIQASNDGTEYKTIKEFTNDIVGGGQNWNIDLSDNANGYKYYRIVATDTSYADSNAANQTVITELTITAKELAKVGGTIEDADYYTDKLLSYAPIVRGKRYYFKQADKQRDTGTYTFTLDKDYTGKLLFVGNGGGGCSSQKDSRWHYSSGGSGACFEGLVRLPADTYTLTIGSLGYGNNANNTHYHSSSVVSTDSYLTNSAGEELIRVGAGGNGYTSVGGVGGAAGVLTLGALEVVETKKATDGVYTAGNTAAGSVSAYDGTYTGYGAGTGAQRGQGNVYGIKGVFDLALETNINDYTYYEDIGTKVY